MSANRERESDLLQPHLALRVGAGKHAGWRCVQAFCVAAAVCALLGAITHGIGNVKSYAKDAIDLGVPAYDGLSCLEGSDWATDPTNPPRRTPSSDWLELTKTFHIPLDSEDFELLGRGSFSSGHLRLRAVDDGSQDMVVQVNATYSHREVIHDARVCVMNTTSRHWRGLVLSTPTTHFGHSQRSKNPELMWSVDATIPAGANISRSRFATEMYNLSHNLDLDNLTFKDISLWTTDAPISLRSKHVLVNTTVVASTTNAPITANLRANVVRLLTSNEPIEGYVAANSRVELSTSNSPITANVHLYTRDHIDPNEFSMIELITSNAPIQSEISLFANPENNSGGGSYVVAQTTNSPAQLTVAESPLNHTLNLYVRTTNGRADVRLHPAFEGHFGAETSSADEVIFVKGDVDDPSGQGRERKFEDFQWNRSGRRGLRGRVGWGTTEGKLGVVDVRTSGAPVMLVV